MCARVITTLKYDGMLECWHGSLEMESIRPKCPRSVDAACTQLTFYIQYYSQEP